MELAADAYRLLFDATPLPIFVSDRETLQILEVNAAACEHYGWSREEFLAMTLRDMRPAEEIRTFEASFADPTEDARPTYSRLGRHRTKDGRIIDVTLEISHQLVRAMDGEIAVESSPGKGSTFSVILPVATAQRAAASDARTGGKLAARILRVDDEPPVGRSLSILLAPETEVVAVTRAGDAIARIRRGERFDAILCDLMMPEITGVELYNELAHAAPDCASRVIFMTGGAFTQQAREFLASTDRPHLEKPFTEAQLRRAIETLREGTV